MKRLLRLVVVPPRQVRKEAGRKVWVPSKGNAGWHLVGPEDAADVFLLEDHQKGNPWRAAAAEEWLCISAAGLPAGCDGDQRRGDGVVRYVRMTSGSADSGALLPSMNGSGRRGGGVLFGMGNLTANKDRIRSEEVQQAC